MIDEDITLKEIAIPPFYYAQSREKCKSISE